MNSRKYWQSREIENAKKTAKSEKAYYKELQRIYKDALENIEKEINAFYGRYAKAEGITIAEARKAAKNADIERLAQKAKKYVEEAAADRKKYGYTDKTAEYFQDQANAEMRLYNVTMKINRLELLKAEIGLELLKATETQGGVTQEALKERTYSEIERQAGILGETVKQNAFNVQSIVNASYKNASYSDRIWTNHSALRDAIGTELERGITQGLNPNVLARNIKKQFDVSRYAAERLMRTELTRVQTDAQMAAYKKYGYDEYQFISTEDRRTCDVCRNAEKQSPYRVKDLLAGENAPPMHPNCRCSTAAYIDVKAYEEWLDAKDSGAFAGSFKEWKTASENGKIKTSARKFTTGKSVNDFFYSDKHKNWASRLSDKQVKAIYDYTIAGYAEINSYLRNPAGTSKTFSGRIKEQISLIDDAISGYELGEDIITYRTVDKVAFGEYASNMKALEGKTWKDSAFVSTTPSLETFGVKVDDLLTDSSIGDALEAVDECLLEISVPKGTGAGAYINRQSAYADAEYEFLISRGSKFNVTSVEKTNNKWHVKMEMVRDDN